DAVGAEHGREAETRAGEEGEGGIQLIRVGEALVAVREGAGVAEQAEGVEEGEGGLGVRGREEEAGGGEGVEEGDGEGEVALPEGGGGGGQAGGEGVEGEDCEEVGEVGEEDAG
ncbi:hypothetical protein LTR53_018763, partial [Teratosphaeriaceae sp. CCFEE 6253]